MPDFAVLVHGTREDAETPREEVAGVLATLGLRLAEANTRVVRLSEGFPFLGFRIQWRRKRGTSKRHVCTFIDERPVRSLKARIRALTPRTSQLDLEYVLTRLNQVVHGKRRRRDCEQASFTFPGYTFRARNAPNRDGTSMFTGFLPAVSKDALKRMSEEVAPGASTCAPARNCKTSPRGST
jgi:hypothetical protein